MRNQSSTYNKKGVVILLLAILVLVSLFLFTNNKKEESVDKNVVLTYEGKEYTFNNDLDLCLITGLDTFEQETTEGFRNDQLSDFLVLLVIDDENETITPIHINRDSMVDFNTLDVKGNIVGETNGQIALSHTYGDGGLESLVNVKDAVSDLFSGVHIDYYVSITMDSIPLINDEIGYVTVYMDEDYTNIDPNFIKDTYVTLKGQQALYFVRDRYDAPDSSNLARMVRQEEYMDEFVKKFNEGEYDALSLIESISEYMVSNANGTDLSVLVNKIKTYQFNDFVTLKGEAVVNTNMEYYLDEEDLKRVTATYLLQEID